MKKILLLVALFVFSYGVVEAQSFTSTSISSITQITAQLNATVDLTGGSGTYYIKYEYKLSTDPPFAWAHVGYSSGTAPATINGNIALTGLTANTGYDYRALLLDGGGATVLTSATVPFTTLALPSTTTTTLGTVTQTTAVVNATGSTSGSTLTTGFGYRLASAGGPFTPVAATPSTINGTTVSYTATITGLSPSSTYDYISTLYDASGITLIAYSSTVQLNTPAAVIPTISTGTFGTITSTSIEVTGNNITADGGASITAHGLQGGTVSGSENYTLTKNNGSSTVPNLYDMTGTGFSPSTKYYLAAYATNSAGTAFGSEISVYTAPGTSSNFTTINGVDHTDKTKLTLNWVNGDGHTGGNGGRLIVAYRYLSSTGISPTPTPPVDGTVYSASAAFGSGDNLITANGYILYAGHGVNKLDVTTLIDGNLHDYEFYIYEYAGSGSDINYKTTSPGFISTDGTTFPIELLSFTATNKDDKIQIEWATASEWDNDYFEIERSTDAENFEVIASVPGAGSSNEVLTYSIQDNDALEGTVYYRLKQTDFNGDFTYSFILPVTIGAKQELQISNIINNEYNISFVFNNPTDAKTNVELLDMSGRVVRSQVISSSQLIRFNKQGLSNGVYMLRLVQDDEAITEKVVF